MGPKTIKTVAEKDYEYDIHEYENPEKRFYRKHSSKDFEMILRQAKGPARFYLWKIQYKTHKALDLVRQGIGTIRTKGFTVFLRKTSDYIRRRRKNE